ncbi:MAG: hypothetical protein ACJATI_000927 [Halioglobus sp.]|jgi:hypothetical protein
MRIILLLILTAFISCKPDNTATKSSVSETSKTEATGNKSVKEFAESKPTVSSAETRATKGKVETNFNKNGIPDACDLLTLETISKYVGFPAASINIADGSSPKNQLQRACFFKWDGSDIKNAGVMVQLQQNPVADDVPDYLTYMIQSLKSDGENNMNGAVIKFYDWPEFGDDGAYSTEAGKYVWRVGNDWAFMIAFNTTMKARDQQKAAKAYAKEVMERMTF